MRKQVLLVPARVTGQLVLAVYPTPPIDAR